MKAVCARCQKEAQWHRVTRTKFYCPTLPYRTQCEYPSRTADEQFVLATRLPTKDLTVGQFPKEVHTAVYEAVTTYIT